MPRDPVKTLLRRTERLAFDLLGANFKGAQGLWDYQLSLLALQRDIQKAIARAKSDSRDGEDRGRLGDLRIVRWHARRLGDAFAWILFGADRRAITPLTANSKVPIPEDGPGHRGVLSIAQHLTNEGWGFPVLHDVTDFLRIGDVTFVHPREGNVSRTIEVKTRLTASDVDGDERVETLSVTVMHPSDVEPTPWAPGSERATGDRVLGVQANRTERQLARMRTAKAHREAPDGQVVEIDGRPVLSTSVEDSTTPHWVALRRAIRRSRATGYAFEVLDGVSLIAAFYSREGMSKDLVERSTVASDLTSSGILPPGNPHNSIVVSAVPAEETRGAHRWLPFFLYPIPKRAIADLLNGRLSVMVMTNPGQIISALKDAGFTVAAPAGNPLAGEGLTVSSTVSTPNGEFNIETHGLNFYFHEVVHEFKSVEYLLLMAREMRDAAGAAVAARQVVPPTAGPEPV